MSSYSRILVPVPPGYGDDARRAMEVARALLAPGGRITVITVLEELPRYLSVQVPAMRSALEDNQRTLRQTATQDFAADDVEVVTATGHPTRVILDAAQEGGHDCIVIASAQPGWQNAFLGSTASGVVRHATCSVHVLRDAGSAART